jgi:hypothetical protein
MRLAAAVLALVAAVALPGAAAAAVKTGQSPDCRRYCMKVEPREGPEGSVFVLRGRGWLPDRRVTATFGVYCPPGEACIDIAYIVRLRTDDRGRFVFRQRAGGERPGDEGRGIHAGGAPTFTQRGVSRSPRYRVTAPG